MDTNLVEIWLRRDPIRWFAGALAGVFAGLVALGFAMVVAKASGLEVWFPIKLMATLVLGPPATEFGMTWGSILAGLAVIEAFSVIFGVLYAHFTGTNFLQALLGMGLVWGIFTWVFVWNLFLQSFPTILSARVPSSVAFPICVIFGLSLTSVAFFHQVMKRQ